MSGVHPPLYEGKKGIVVQSTSLSGKSSDKMIKTRSPDELNYVTRQIVEQLPDQVEATSELQRFLNENLKFNRIIFSLQKHFISYFSFVIFVKSK